MEIQMEISDFLEYYVRANMDHKKYYDMLSDENATYEFSEVDYAFFDKHNLSLYFYGKDDALKRENLIAYKANLLMYKLDYKNKLAELCDITKALEERSIDYLILKGICISETYPEPSARIMGDHDILVKPHDFERAIDALGTIGYIADEKTVTFKDVTLYKEDQLMIELHHAILRKDQECYAAHFTDALWQSSIRYDYDFGTLNVPEPEMHFRYITLHMMKHLKGMGFGLRHLLDFKYFALAHHIDIEKQLVFFNEIGYGVFYRAVATICHYELNMPIDSEAWLFPRELSIVQILADYIAEMGVFGRGSEKINIERQFERFQNAVKGGNKLMILLVSIFPGKALLTDRYHYAIKTKWFLPIAWGHRIIRAIFSREMPIKEKLFYFSKDEQNMAEVAYMMNSLGLREEMHTGQE